MSTPGEKPFRLTCQACQRKKIKCDRKFPCTQCTRSNLQCLANTRKPRARPTPRNAIDSELRSRVSKLEGLVQSLSGELAVSTSDRTLTGGDPKSESTGSPGVGRYIGSAFWSSLTSEVRELKDVLEDERSDEDEPSSPAPLDSTEIDPLLLSPESDSTFAVSSPDLPEHLVQVLCDTFCNSVDRITKVYHTPTLRGLVIEGRPYLGQQASSAANKAVRAAVFFAAISTLSDINCQQMFGQSKHDQVRQARQVAEIAFARADLFITNDLATVQAFATFLMALRLSDQSCRVWTMTAILVRLARAMGLHHELTSRTPFETELRRRLWHNIRFIDVFTSWDRGSADLLIGMSTYDTPLALNLNDVEIQETSITICGRTGVTDITFANILYESINYTHRFTSPESAQNEGDTWEDRIHTVHKFEARINDTYIDRIDQSDPFHRLLAAVFQIMLSSHILRAARPLRRHPQSTAPRVNTPYVLQLANNALKATDLPFHDQQLAQFAWLAWVPWHPLATALASLCSIRDTDLANDTWVHVEKTYTRQASLIADSRRGMLWKPIEKLYKRARAFREHRETSIAPTPYMSSSTFDSTMQQPASADTPSISGNVDIFDPMINDFDMNNNMDWWVDLQNFI